MKNKVVVIGSYNTDLTIKTRRIPHPGETIIGGVFSQGGGGKGANQAVAAARAGADVCFVARVGDDVLGYEGIQRLAKDGINTDFIIRDQQAPTGVAFIMVDEFGENSIVVASGANSKLSVKDIEDSKEQIRSSMALLVQLESPIDVVRRAIKLARENGIVTILNPAPAQTLDRDLLRGIDIITPNKVEAEMISGMKITDENSLQKIAQRLSDLGVVNSLITLGSKGVFIGIPGIMELLPAYKVESIDSTGAGDVFSGSLSAFLAEGKPIEEAIRMSMASACLSVKIMGAQNSAPNRTAIENFISAHSPSQEIRIKQV